MFIDRHLRSAVYWWWSGTSVRTSWRVTSCIRTDGAADSKTTGPSHAGDGATHLISLPSPSPPFPSFSSLPPFSSLSFLPFFPSQNPAPGSGNCCEPPPYCKNTNTSLCKRQKVHSFNLEMYQNCVPHFQPEAARFSAICTMTHEYIFTVQFGRIKRRLALRLNQTPRCKNGSSHCVVAKKFSHQTHVGK